MSEDIVIGKIIAPIGVKGEVKAICLTDFPERFEKGNKVSLNISGEPKRTLLIETSREHKDGFVIKLEGINSREEADILRNTELVIGKNEVGKLPDDSFYIFDLIGLDVVTDEGRNVGKIVDVIHTGANDVYYTDKKVCIPALKQVVLEIDITGKKMLIHPMPGLIPDSI
jgi:16S rRNA processing protein RimM